MTLVHRLAICWFPALVALVGTACGDGPDPSADTADVIVDDGDGDGDGSADTQPSFPDDHESPPGVSGGCTGGRTCIAAPPSGWRGPAALAIGEVLEGCPDGWSLGLDVHVGEVAADDETVAWGDPALLCIVSGASCGAGRCAAPVPPPFARACVYQAGDLPCPEHLGARVTVFAPTASAALVMEVADVPLEGPNAAWQTEHQQPITVCCAD